MRCTSLFNGMRTMRIRVNTKTALKRDYDSSILGSDALQNYNASYMLYLGYFYEIPAMGAIRSTVQVSAKI